MSDQFKDETPGNEPEQEYDESELEGWFEESAEENATAKAHGPVGQSDEDRNNLPRVNYTEFKGGFNGMVLEESLVMNVKNTMSYAEFKVDFAVNQNYPLFTAPPEGSDYEYTYRQGRIFFPNMEQIRWSSRVQPTIDPSSGSVDYGSIDYFYRQGDWYYMAGFWGEMEIQSAEPMLEIPELMEYDRQQYQAAKESQQGPPNGGQAQ